MNQTQIKYARGRLEEIYSSKVAEIKNAFVPVKINLNTDQKIEEIKAGRFKKGNFEGLSYLIFDKEVLQDPDKEKREGLLKSLKDLKIKTLDELLLGDAEEAIQALVKLEKFEV